MRFGLLIRQGWRLDVITPTADANVGSSMGINYGDRFNPPASVL